MKAGLPKEPCHSILLSSEMGGEKSAFNRDRNGGMFCWNNHDDYRQTGGIEVKMKRIF